jgi:hypothetical protein
MKTVELKIYGRNRFKFQDLFPDAKFEGYECNITFGYFTIPKKRLSQITRECGNAKIQILEQI